MFGIKAAEHLKMFFRVRPIRADCSLAQSGPLLLFVIRLKCPWHSQRKCSHNCSFWTKLVTFTIKPTKIPQYFTVLPLPSSKLNPINQSCNIYFLLNKVCLLDNLAHSQSDKYSHSLIRTHFICKCFFPQIRKGTDFKCHSICHHDAIIDAIIN